MTVAGHDVAVGGRQRRWHEIHDRVYEAACALFIESDFASTSYDAIADRAGVARKTAFNHYARKRDFISEWGQRRRLHVERALAGDDAPSSFEGALRRYFDALAELSAQQRILTRRMLLGWRETGGPFDEDPHRLISVFSGLATGAIDRGELRGTAKTARLGVLLYSCYFGVLYDWVEGPDDRAPFDLHRAYASMLDGVLRGFVTDPQ